MKFALLRHPAPDIATGICYGRLNIGLHPAAAADIPRLAADPALAFATRVWSSPARRCQALAAAIAVHLAIPLTLDPRLQELDFGGWEGQPWDAIPRPVFDLWAADPVRHAPPGGETGASLIDRVTNFHHAIRDAGEPGVIVSHGGALKVLTALLLNQPVDLFVGAPAIGSCRIIACPEAGSVPPRPCESTPAARATE